MRVALIGATGNVGSRVLAELVRRGHSVTAISRNPDRGPSLVGVVPKRGNVIDQHGVVQLFEGARCRNWLDPFHRDANCRSRGLLSRNETWKQSLAGCLLAGILARVSGL